MTEEVSEAEIETHIHAAMETFLECKANNDQHSAERQAFIDAGWRAGHDSIGFSYATNSPEGTFLSTAVTKHLYQDDPDTMIIPPFVSPNVFCIDGDKTPPEGAWRVRSLYRSEEDPYGTSGWQARRWALVRSDSPETAA